MFVDATRVVQIISNVLNNAIKFSHPGGRIACAARIETTAAGDTAVITVSDDGAGIDAATLPGIFELFVQGKSTSAGHGGLGIGLALARRLIEMHDGVIDGESAGPGKGSTFTMRIPVAEASVAAVPVAAAPATTPVARRVLIVDDNADSTEVLQMLVSHWGAAVRTAHDGESAVPIAAEFNPDVVLLDIGLPGIDGYETCRRLRQQCGTGVTIVALTGWGQDRDKRRAQDAGFDAHLTKPADPVALEALLMKGAAPGRNAI
jgi:CheY-like chemotaxis protein